MEIRAGGRNIQVQGDRVFVDGKEVSPSEGKSEKPHESAASSEARAVLEAKYPGVNFKGDCSKIKVQDSVVLENGATIEQNDDSVIEISGHSVIKEGAYISTPISGGGISLNSISISGSGATVISNVRGISISSGNISIGGDSESGTVRVSNSTIGRQAGVRGLSIELVNANVLDRCKVTCDGSGDIDVSESEIGADVICSGSGDISIEESKIAAIVQCTGSGDIEIKNSSIVNGSVSVRGSGDISVSATTIEPSGSLSVTGSGSIKAKNGVVSIPQSVTGHKSIRI